MILLMISLSSVFFNNSARTSLFSIFSVDFNRIFLSFAFIAISSRITSSLISSSARFLLALFLSNLAISANTFSSLPSWSYAILLASLYFAVRITSSRISGSLILDATTVRTNLSFMFIISSRTSCDLISITAATRLFRFLCEIAISFNVSSRIFSSSVLLSFLRRFSLLFLSSSSLIVL